MTAINSFGETRREIYDCTVDWKVAARSKGFIVCNQKQSKHLR